MFLQYFYNFSLFLCFMHLVYGYVFPVLWDDQKSVEKRDTETRNTTVSLTSTLSAETSHSSTASKSLPPCDDDKLMSYLAELQAINPESIINLSTMDDLDVLCNKVSDNLDNVDEFLKTCEPSQQKDLYIQLIKGVDSLYQNICNDGKFRTSFEKHLKCIQELHEEYEDCNGPADWNEDMSKENVCKAYQDIIDCYYIKTANVCGKEAAHLMRELSKAVVGSILTHDCGKMKGEPKVDKAIPDEFVEKSVPSIPPSSGTNKVYLNIEIIAKGITICFFL